MKHEDVIAAGVDIDTLPRVGGGTIGECGHCRRFTIVENHHYAPRQNFGAECESWIQGPLCDDCHREWHEKMGQPIRRRKAS